MSEDTRCCGTGTCLINAQSLCWCGQRWQGDTLCGPSGDTTAPALAPAAAADQAQEA